MPNYGGLCIHSVLECKVAASDIVIGVATGLAGNRRDLGRRSFSSSYVCHSFGVWLLSTTLLVGIFNFSRSKNLVTVVLDRTHYDTGQLLLRAMAISLLLVGRIVYTWFTSHGVANHLCIPWFFSDGPHFLTFRFISEIAKWAAPPPKNTRGFSPPRPGLTSS